MNWSKFITYFFVTFAVVHMVWGFYDRYEKNSFCNSLVQNAMNRNSTTIAEIITEEKGPGGLCHSRFSGLNLFADIVVLAIGIYRLREQKEGVS